jgi:hypothetical protein
MIIIIRKDTIHPSFETRVHASNSNFLNSKIKKSIKRDKDRCIVASKPFAFSLQNI